MEVVALDGKEYVKASVLAARFKYTADYVGQLCRSRKVDARLIGRAWYVNVDSLNAHKDTRYKPTPKTVLTVTEDAKEAASPSRYLSRIDVEPILKKKTVSIYQANKKGGLDEVKVKYEDDDYSLIPRVHKEAVSTRMDVDPADAEEVRVKKEGSAEARFKAEALPEVWLRGTLKVAGIAEATEEAEPFTNPESEEEGTEAVIEPETKPERIEIAEKPKSGPIIKVRPRRLREIKKTGATSVLEQVPIVSDHAVDEISPLNTPVAAHSNQSKVLSEQRHLDPRSAQSRNITQTKPLLTSEGRKPVSMGDIHPRTMEVSASSTLSTSPTIEKATLGALPLVSARPNATPLTFKPVSVEEKHIKSRAKQTGGGGKLVPMTMMIFAFLIAGTLLTLQVDIIAQNGQSTPHFFVSTAQLEAAVSLIR